MLSQGLLERPIARHQEQVRHLIGAGDRHLCPRHARQRCELRRPRLEGAETHDHGVPIALSTLGQANACAGALEQWRAQMLLEAGHLAADCRLRGGKLDCGPRCAAVARGALEGDQGTRGAVSSSTARDRPRCRSCLYPGWHRSSSGRTGTAARLLTRKSPDRCTQCWYSAARELGAACHRDVSVGRPRGEARVKRLGVPLWFSPCFHRTPTGNPAPWRGRLPRPGWRRQTGLRRRNCRGWPRCCP